MPSEVTEASRHLTETDIPDPHGRTAVVTGASTGLSFEVARMLAGPGAIVIMAWATGATPSTSMTSSPDTATAH